MTGHEASNTFIVKSKSFTPNSTFTTIGNMEIWPLFVNSEILTSDIFLLRGPLVFHFRNVTSQLIVVMLLFKSTHGD